MFYPGDDAYWEAVNLWYGATGDLEWYDPVQITMRDGYLVITMDSVDTLQAFLTPNSLPLYHRSKPQPDLPFRHAAILEQILLFERVL